MGLLQVSGAWGSVLLGIFILKPAFMVCSCSSLGLHGPRTSGMPIFLRGCTAGREGPCWGCQPGAVELGPSVPGEGQAKLRSILHPLWLAGADVGNCCLTAGSGFLNPSQIFLSQRFAFQGRVRSKQRGSQGLDPVLAEGRAQAGIACGQELPKGLPGSQD